MDSSDSAGKEGRPRVDHPDVFPFSRGWNWRVFTPPLENPENEFRQEASQDLHIAPNLAAAGNQAPIGTPGYQSAANYYAPSPSIGPGYHTAGSYNSHPYTGPALPASSEGPSHLNNLPAAVAGGVGNYEQTMNPSEEVDSHGKFKTEEVPHDNREKYKTQLCYHWERHGYCLYGDHCTFAHGEQELRPVTRHALYKTELCYNVLAGGSCSYGHQCHFRHASDNI